MLRKFHIMQNTSLHYLKSLLHKDLYFPPVILADKEIRLVKYTKHMESKVGNIRTEFN